MIKLTKITLNKVVDTPVAGDKKPCHIIVASDDGYQNKTTVGSLWLKSGQMGNFLSGELKRNRVIDGKDYDGYVIITEKEWDEYQNLKKNVTVTPSGYNGEVADTSSIDF